MRTNEERHKAHEERVKGHKSRLAQHTNPVDKAKELSAILTEDLNVVIASVQTATKEEIIEELDFIKSKITDNVKDIAKALVGK